jgi:hypothetical protein
MAFSSRVESSSTASATTVFSTVALKEMDCDAPSARNSNLLPVKAKGLVRFRSPACFGRFGSTCTPSPRMPPCFELFAVPSSAIWSKMSVSWSPRKTDMMAGGASLAPSRWSFPA